MRLFVYDLLNSEDCSLLNLFFLSLAQSIHFRLFETVQVLSISIQSPSHNITVVIRHVLAASSSEDQQSCLLEKVLKLILGSEQLALDPLSLLVIFGDVVKYNDERLRLLLSCGSEFSAHQLDLGPAKE